METIRLVPLSVEQTAETLRADIKRLQEQRDELQRIVEAQIEFSNRIQQRLEQEKRILQKQREDIFSMETESGRDAMRLLLACRQG